MDITKSSGPDLLPRADPSPNLIEADPAILQALDTLDSLPRHILRWVIALATAFYRRQMWRYVRGYRFAAYGFADPEFESDDFCVLLYAFPIPGFQDEVMWLEVGDDKFPVYVRRSVEIYHASLPVHPSLGTAACWAQSSKISAPGNLGFVTAKHVLGGAQPGSPAQTTRGQGTVLDIGPDGIDAALVEPPPSVSPVLGSRLTVVPIVAPWTDVSFDGSQSGRIQTKVTSVTDTRGSLNPHVPARVFLAHHGKNGDSGALVLDSGGQGVGIYTAMIVDAAGRAEGCSQLLAQVEYVMQLTLYQ